MDNFKNLKKYIPKRKFRERSQLSTRKHLGELEKKQDYKIRAEDFHKKKQRYNKLIESARGRNPDEFYFGMVKSSQNELDKEEKIGKYTNLLNHRINILEHKLEKEKQEMPSLLKGSNIHKIYVDSFEDAEKFKAEEYFESEVVENSINRVKKTQLQSRIYKEDNTKTINPQSLVNIHNNLNDLYRMREGIAYKRNEMALGKKRKMEDGSIRFFRERNK